MELEVTLTCKVTSTGFCLAGELASISRKRMVLHMRRAMKMMGMRVSFLSAMVDSDWDVGLVAKMGLSIIKLTKPITFTRKGSIAISTNIYPHRNVLCLLQDRIMNQIS